MEIKVLFVIHEYVFSGGAEHSFFDMIMALDGKVRMCAVVPKAGEIQQTLENKGIKTFIIDMYLGYGKKGEYSKEKSSKDIVINYEAGIKIADIIRLEKVDVVHINSSICNAGAIGAIMAGVPYVWHIRELLKEQFDRDYWNFELKKILFDYSSQNIAISEVVGDVLRNNYDLDSKVIYNAINSGNYYEDLEKKTFEDYSFILAGRICKEKGQMDAIKAIKILKNMGYSGVRLLLVGRYDNRFRWYLNQYIKKYGLENNIYLLEHQKDLREIRERCSYALVTSSFEALGRVTVEAMYAGNLVIGANTAGTAEIIGKNKYGYTYHQGDENDLAQVMLKAMLDSQEIKKEIIKEAQNYVCKTFDMGQYANNIISIYSDVCRDFINKYDKVKNVLVGEYNKQNLNYYNDCNVINSNFGEVLNELENNWDENKENINKILKSLPDSIAIYGMGRLGMRLYENLIFLEKKIDFIVDRNEYFFDGLFKTYSGIDDIPMVDCIIVTAIRDFDNIRNSLSKYKNIQIINILDIIGT